MKDRKLATRYARALLASLPDPGVAEEVDHFLGALRSAFEESAAFRAMMLDPALPRSTRKTVLRTLAEQSGMPVQMANFLSTVVDHSRTPSLPSIAEVFHEQREAAAGIVAAEVTTAWPLTDDLRERTLRVLRNLTGRQIHLTTTVEPEILGGVIMRVGTDVRDGSLRTHLARLRQRMMQE